MAISVGAHLGPYEVLCRIGAGGMGEVYKARDTRLDRIVALKLLPAHLADEPTSRERFEREARTIASLIAPGPTIVDASIRGVGTTGPADIELGTVANGAGPSRTVSANPIGGIRVCRS